MNRGWTCPNCGGCYSPATPQCFNCTGRTNATSGCCIDPNHWSQQSTLPKVYPEGYFPIKIVSKEELKEQFPDKPDDSSN